MKKVHSGNNLGNDKIESTDDTLYDRHSDNTAIIFFI